LSLFALTIAGICGALAGCTMVPAEPESENVRVVGPGEVAGCKRISSTTVSVLSKVGFLPRRRELVAGELETLAKNSAAKKGGDSVVAAGEPEDGGQTFDIYDCRGGWGGGY
jgi:hypothetical protein